MVFRFGLEVECEVNSELRNNIRVGSYHAPRRVPGLKNWSVQHDSSLNTTILDYSIEFTTAALTLEKQLQNVKNLIDFCKKYGSYGKSFKINKSCGCHIHFSVYDKYEGKFDRTTKKASTLDWSGRRCYYFNLLKIRDEIFSKVEKQVPHAFNEFKAQYFRGAAVASDFMHIEGRERRVEWNYCSLRKGQGMEWRGFNLQGVKNFDDMYKMLQIALTTLHDYLEAKEENVIFKVVPQEGKTCRVETNVIIPKCVESKYKDEVTQNV